MSSICVFAAHLANGGADATKILQETDLAFTPGTMSRQNVNAMICAAKAGQDATNCRGTNTPLHTRAPEAISTIAALVEKDRKIMMNQIEAETNFSPYMVQMILTEDLKLSKKAKCWIPCLLLPHCQSRLPEIHCDHGQECGGLTWSSRN